MSDLADLDRARRVVELDKRTPRGVSLLSVDLAREVVALAEEVERLRGAGTLFEHMEAG